MESTAIAVRIHRTGIIVEGKSHIERAVGGFGMWIRLLRLSRNFDWQREKFVQHRYGIRVYISKQSE